MLLLLLWFVLFFLDLITTNYAVSFTFLRVLFSYRSSGSSLYSYFVFVFFNIYLSIISLIKEAIISHVVDLFSRYRSYYSFRIIVRRTYVFQKAIRYYFSQSLSYYITMDTTDHLTLYVGLSLSRLRHSLPFLPSRRTEDLRKWWLRRGFGAKKWWCGFVLSFRLFLVFRKGRDFFSFFWGVWVVLEGLLFRKL